MQWKGSICLRALVKGMQAMGYWGQMPLLHANLQFFKAPLNNHIGFILKIAQRTSNQHTINQHPVIK